MQELISVEDINFLAKDLSIYARLFSVTRQDKVIINIIID